MGILAGPELPPNEPTWTSTGDSLPKQPRPYPGPWAVDACPGDGPAFREALEERNRKIEAWERAEAVRCGIVLPDTFDDLDTRTPEEFVEDHLAMKRNLARGLRACGLAAEAAAIDPDLPIIDSCTMNLEETQADLWDVAAERERLRQELGLACGVDMVAWAIVGLSAIPLVLGSGFWATGIQFVAIGFLAAGEFLRSRALRRPLHRIGARTEARIAGERAKREE